ncbi:MAG: PAS domain S-box protein [Cyclobacteriaceae bacterium]|nr:PAS domain S-box protein [Cyclobacteriaceae bacterium]
MTTKKKDDLLKKSFDLFFTIFENNTIGMIFTDLKTTKFAFVNSAFLTISGYTKEEIIGKKSFEINLIEPMVREENLSQLRKESELRNVEMSIRKKNGETFCALVSAQTVTLEGKNYAVSSFIDISKQKKVEELLRKSNDLFINLFDHNPAAIAISSLKDAKIININAAFLDVFGFTCKEEVIGKTAAELDFLVRPEQRAEMTSFLKENKSVKNYEAAIITSKGESKVVSASALILELNEEPCLFSVTIDITEKHKLEERLRQLATIVDFSDDAIHSKSPDGIIKTWNKGAEKMYGYTFEEVLGKHISLIIPPEYINEEKGNNLRVQNQEIISHYETVRMKRNGEQFYVSLSTSPIKDKLENIVGIAVISRDITERKKAEDSSKLKDAFLSIISHEIRTPLNAIMGFSDILAKRKLGDQEKEYITIIKSAGYDLLKIINDIIDMSKIEAGTMVFEETSISVKELFQSLNEMMTAKAGKKNLSLSFNCSKEVPAILFGDQKRLEQIIISLTNNAIDFTENGTIDVQASVLNKEDKNILIEFSVSDTGTGISLDKIKTIFDRFRQIEPHDKRKQGGVGLGLSIAKRLVELQGGSMTVESELKKGSVFTFSVPYKN